MNTAEKETRTEQHPVKQTKSMVGGMTVLGITGIVCKLIGVLFSIPLTWLIGTGGQGLFQSVYPTYSLLLTVSSAGLPVAVSRMVSHALTKDDPRSAKLVFRTALIMLTVIGVLLSLTMLTGSGFLARRVDQPESRIGFIVIAPCVAVVCMLSAFRGFMQGQQNMVPTAISQLIEQVGKVCISLPLAWLGMQKGGIAYGAAGALLGITCVEAIALLYMVLCYVRKKKAFCSLPQLETGRSINRKEAMTQLIRISVPITISACIVPLANFIDSAMLVKRMMVAGLDMDTARRYYGIFAGLVIRLINIPTALALSISMSLVPAVAAAVAAGSMENVRRQSNLGLRFAFLIGFPCSVGMSLLSKHILAFFYARTLTATELQVGSEVLAISSLTVLLFTVVQATSAILQGVHKQRLPMYTLVAGVACKITLNYILVGTPGIHVHGGPFASLACYTVSMIPNLYFVTKYTGLRFQWNEWVVKPGMAAALMGAAVLGLRAVLPMNHFTTLLMIAIGSVVYLAAALLLKAIRREDFASLRRGKKGKA